MTNVLRATSVILILISLWFSIDDWGVSNSYESSGEYLYHFSTIQYLYSLLFAVSFLTCTYLKIKFKRGILLIIFFLWFSAGRYFYLKEFTSCSIGTSIYFYQDNRFDLCGKSGNNYEVEMTKIYYEKLPFWRIRFISDSDKRIIFIGPFAWNSTINILSSSSMKGK